MESKYFVKYLPLDGDILKEELPCKVLDTYSGTLLDYTKDSFGSNASDYYRKTKLFLCEKNPQIGDTVMVFPDGHVHNITFELLSISEDRYAADIKYLTNSYKPEIVGRVRDWKYDMLYKVLGELSPAATWVKEGDEFDEYKVFWWSIEHSNIICAYIEGDEELVMFKDSKKLKKIYAVKCDKCNTFH